MKSLKGVDVDEKKTAIYKKEVKEIWVYMKEVEYYDELKRKGLVEKVGSLRLP